MNNLKNCAEFLESYELYALGILDGEEKEGIDEHLASNCVTCRASVQRALLQNAMISGTVEIVKPSAQLRQRVLASFGEQSSGRQRSEGNWFWAFAATAAVLVLTAFGLLLQNRVLRTELSDLGNRNTVQLARLAAASQILQSPTTRLVTFGPGTAPHGSVFIHAQLGIVMVAGTLAPPPAGWTYETWIIPASGVPQAVEPFTPDPNGTAITIVPGSVGIAAVKAVAVSLEPPGATLQKPTKVLFAAKL